MAYGFSVRGASPFAAYSHQSFDERLIVEPPLAFLKHSSQTQQIPRTANSSWAPLLVVCMLLATVAAVSYIIPPSAGTPLLPAAATWLRQHRQQEQSLQQWQAPAIARSRSAVQQGSSKATGFQYSAYLLQQEQQPVVNGLPEQATQASLQTGDSRQPLLAGFTEHITIWYTKPLQSHVRDHTSKTGAGHQELGHKRSQHRKMLHLSTRLELQTQQRVAA